MNLEDRERTYFGGNAKMKMKVQVKADPVKVLAGSGTYQADTFSYWCVRLLVLKKY